MLSKLNYKGNIGIAIVIVIIAVMSGVSLAAVAFRDSASFRLELDSIQQFHIIRSEVGRGRFVASHLESLHNPPAENILPTRTISIQFGNHRTVYEAQTRLSVIEDHHDTGFNIRTLVSAMRGDGDLYNSDNVSPIRKYAENHIESLQTLALFHYFSDIDRSVNDVPGGIVFWEGDIIHGRVHSNTDIYLRNNSWPEFHGLVSTSGMIKVSGGGTNYPENEIFLGPPPALIENYPRISFDPTADLVRARGQHLGGSERDDAIAYVTVEGTNYELIIGVVVTENDPPDEWIEDYNQFTIYASYPPYGPVGDSIGVNQIPKTDTLWGEPQAGTLINNSMFVPMELWISGSFQGRQTWASSHDIYLKDDLTYHNTPVGDRPDGRDNEGNLVGNPNPTDYLGIISEECIFLQYGHRDPRDSLRYRPNTEDIYMYGAYAAVGDGEGIAWEDGRITLEYQYPKGSTPQQYWRGEEFKFIDLHLFQYPTSSSAPWPPGLDYPWYNPIWPEPGPIYNVPGLPGHTPNPHDVPEVVQIRGDIILFGSFAQRRRGAVGVLAGGVIPRQWNMNGEIDPNILPTYGSIPPNRTGYEKRYTTDLRFEHTGPPHYPLIIFEGYDTDELRDLGYNTRRWIFKTPPRSL